MLGDASTPVAIDLFSGVGGMSLGFKSAGFQIAGAFDAEQRHVDTYNRNFPLAPATMLDLGQATGSKIRKLSALDDREVDLLFGGPPCQGFSVGGRRDESDPRNQLLLDFARLVKEINPRYFVVENVAGLLLGYGSVILDYFCDTLEQAGFAVVKPIQVLDAADYGVPQRRRRVFVLGRRRSESALTYPAPEPLRDAAGRSYFPKVRQAISDLPEIEMISDLLETDGYVGSLGKQSLYARLLHDNLFRCNGDPPATLTGCLRTKHSQAVVKRFKQTKPGAAEPISRYFRLDLDAIAPTLRAGTASDKGSHTAPRPIHPIKPRCITVREAARLHSFPDWFQFHPSRWHAFRQIGNSVPPLLAYRVGLAVRGKLMTTRREHAHDCEVRKRSG